MELYEIKNGLEKAHLLLEQLSQSLDVSTKEMEIESLTAQTLEEGFWNDPDHAKRIYDRLTGLKKAVDQYNALNHKLAELNETYELAKEGDEDFTLILDEDYQQFEIELDAFEKDMLLSHEYDHLNAIVEIHPGAGGTESQDWAEMLFRMYTRFSNKADFKVEVLDYLDGEEAGIKSVTFLVKGYNAYGYLKSEKGVHRLVRISPFDSNARRHTSFASVDVMPEFNNDIEIEVRTEDLRIDTYRSSGAGGQHINTTDSAVRITHIPTGIVTSCQTQRSQIKNREQAMVMLKSKLYQKMIEEQQAKLREIKGEQLEIGWGSQIRSYVMHPYSLVKDARTNYETSQVDRVMDGDLFDFIYAYLRWEIQ
ncbi:peptide chain release factor 2 [Beduini massiliensis]|uniref:peptide chain release factor 2 n=1 Tax=Beduini massiliensis TaxID=1585974 RepID=UPI00059AA42D|nr:peptide chain release factor 2 [Beduini massiliensis]